jgi:hypothetical protein
MADYHTVYKGPEGETTQWEDIQIRLGNMAPKPKPWKPDAYTPEQEEQKDKEWLDKKDEEELAELDDEFQDDRALEEYRWAANALQLQQPLLSAAHVSAAGCPAMLARFVHTQHR